ncbi:MAG: polyprenyl synthetase family protein [Hyphomicrobiales bacterium]|nr:MAG: polyprenyl synthetase family protein [Hyphomicrobiales bacterium]
MVAVSHHQPLRQDAKATVKDAHVDVQRKGRYTLALKKNRGEGDHRRVGRAQKFLHQIGLLPPVARGKGGMDGMDGVGESAVQKITPQDRLSAALAEDMAAVNQLIRERMASEHAPRIPEVTAHLVDAGGKRLRPLLTLAAARLLGYAGADHLKLAATVEFIHTATLLHDDVVDESARRRGRPTANLLWDNKSSVLVGDYLFSRSFQLMVETGNLRVLDILANASATIAEGEVLQLTAAQDLRTDESVYLRVIQGKTAALFAAATEVGGVIAAADEGKIKALRDYGNALGIAFQIVDDMLDYGGSDAVIGKNTGDDFRERKLTLPLIKAVAKSSPDEREFWVRVIEKNNQQDDDLAQAMALLRKHDAISACRSDALDWAAKAKTALNNLPVHPIRDTLSELADFVVSRVS